MKRILAATIGLVALIPGRPAAHRLDEYLQASRVSLERDGILLEVDLTPGANIASGIIPLLDRDGDGVVSPTEARAYGQAVLMDLVLEFDGRPAEAMLSRVEVSSLGEIRDGLGTIRLRAAASTGVVLAGTHRLYFRNDHHPGASVYMVNALVPDAAGINVVTQTRDPRQRAVTIEYTVGHQWPARLLSVVAAVATLSALIALRKKVSSHRWDATSCLRM